MTSDEMAGEIRLDLRDQPDEVPEWAAIIAEKLAERYAKMPAVWRWIFGKGFRFAVEVLTALGERSR